MTHAASPEIARRIELANREKLGAALVSVVANLVLIALKLGVGIATGSLGILAEAAHSALDLAASVFAYAGLRIAARPADDSHPFGHHRFENVSGLAQIALLILTTVLILFEAAQRLAAPPPVIVTWYSFGVIAFSLATDIYMTTYLTRIARRAGGSAALQADALHFSNDMFAAIAVLVGLAFAAFGVAIADPLAAIVVAFIMAGVAARSGAHTVNVLADRSPAPETIERVRALMLEHPEVHAVSSVRARLMGSHVYLDACVTLRRDLTLVEAHRISHEISERVTDHAPEVVDVLVHPEPEPR